MRFIITAGPTQEYLDPVRFISNRSSGKMGLAIALAAHKQGHEVIVIALKNIHVPDELRHIPVTTALDMYKAVEQEFANIDVLVMAAAVSDYRPKEYSSQKIKKHNENICVELIRNPDILKEIGTHKKQQFVVGFAAETENVISSAKKKMSEKNIDMIIANDITKQGAGFEEDTNIVTILYRDGQRYDLDIMSKQDLGEFIVREIEEAVDS